MKVVAVRRDSKRRIQGIKLEDGSVYLGDEMLNAQADGLQKVERDDSEMGFYVKTMPNGDESDNLDNLPEF